MSFCKGRRCERWNDWKIRVPSVPNVPPVHKYTRRTHGTAGTRPFGSAQLFYFETGACQKPGFQPGFSKRMKTAKNLPYLRMDFTEKRCSETCTGYAGQSAFSLFCMKLHGTVKPDMPVYGQDIDREILSGFYEQGIFHQPVKQERLIAYRLHPTTD